MAPRQSWLRQAAAAHWRTWRWRVWAAVVFATAAGISFIPLLGRFGYGFAFCISLVASIAAIDLGCAMVRIARATNAHTFDHARHPARVVGDLWLRAAGTSLALLIAPLGVATINVFRIRTCDIPFGLLAFVLMPMLSVVWGSAVGVALGLVSGSRRRLSRAMPWLFVVAIVTASIARFYSSPPVFFYNPLVGYFPGNLYDQNVDFRAAFYWARTFHFALAILSLGICAALIDVPTLSLLARQRRPLRRQRPIVVACAAYALFAALLWWTSADLGFAISADDIAEGLGGHHRTEHFDIYYPTTPEIEARIDEIARDHEFRLHQVTRDLGVPLPTQRFRSYYFANKDDKHRWMGARNVHMAKPWRREIYVNDQPFPHPIIRHEIAHAVAAEFGSPIFRVSARSVLGLPIGFNPGMIEGLAVAAAWPPSFRTPLTPHESMKAMSSLNLAPSISRVLSPQFFSYSGARSYAAAGSFVRFLLQKHGAAAIRALYRNGGDTEAALGRSLGELSVEWRTMLDAIELEKGEDSMVKERYRHPSILERPCPHYIARAQERSAELAGRGDFAGAVRLWRRVCEQVPDEPRYRLDLAELLTRAKRLDDAARVLQEVANDEVNTTTIRVSALIELASARYDEDDLEPARELLASARDLPVDDDLARNVEAMLIALDDEGPSGPALRRYFFASRDIAPADRRMVSLGWIADGLAKDPHDGLLLYLLGRNLYDRGTPETSQAALERAFESGLSPLVERECLRLLAITAFRAGDYAAVTRAANHLLGDHPTPMRLLGLDWLERVAFARDGVPPAKALVLGDYIPDRNFHSPPSRSSTN